MTHTRRRSSHANPPKPAPAQPGRAANAFQPVTPAGLIQRLRFWLSPPAFTVELDADGARLVQGRLPDRVVAEFAEVARLAHLTAGTIYGIAHGDNTTLEFSPNIPHNHRQRFRNAWGFVK